MRVEVAVLSSWDRLPPARGAVFASGMEAEWRRKRGVSVHDSPAPEVDAQEFAKMRE